MNDNRLLKDNYIKINHIAAKCMRFFVALVVALWAFAFFSRECNLVVVTICMVLCCIFSLIPTLVIDFFKHDRNEAIKYVVICIAVFNLSLIHI